MAAPPASVGQIDEHRDVLTGSGRRHGLRHGLRVGGLAEEATDEIVVAAIVDSQWGSR